LLVDVVAGCGGDLAALGGSLGQDRLAFARLHHVARRTAQQTAHRGEGAEHDPLVPQILDNVGVKAAIAARLLDRHVELDQRRSWRLAAQFAEGEHGHRTGVEHLTFVGERDADARRTAHDPAFAEAFGQDLDMAHAVQLRHDGGIGADRRGNRIERRLEIVSLVTQHNEVVRPAFAANADGLHLLSDVTLGALDDQAVPAKGGAAGWTNQEGDVSTGLLQAAAEIAADRAGAQDQDLHDPLLYITYSQGVLALLAGTGLHPL